MSSDHYATLGVRRDADSAAIKTAYRKLTLELHPDHHPGDAAIAERFRKVHDAYAVLSDPDKRALYDRTGSSSGVVIRSKAHTYRAGAVLCEGDLADLLEATDEAGTKVVLKGVRDTRDDDLIANEAAALQSIDPLGIAGVVRTSEQLCWQLEHELGAPVKLRSYGPARCDKTIDGI